ncbi:MAG: hypothetical protein IH984_12660 [Planctomycetes bacterium]|nr:hypothetical protein [Planctomycetota bacterium]
MNNQLPSKTNVIIDTAAYLGRKILGRVRIGSISLLTGICLLALASPSRGAKPADGYMNHASLTKSLQDLARENNDCEIDAIGSSREGRTLLAITLSSDAEIASSKPALLIVAGLDGRHLVGTETAFRVAKNILANHADILQEITIYVIPRVNPDGVELNLSSINAGHIGVMRAVDSDRDGLINEDGPDDLNGDGIITLMRRLNNPLDDNATHLADPSELRLLKKPDVAKGERAIYSIYPEGIDNDNDGKINEDGPGMVDLDRNFMHEWPEHALDAGPYQVSEPESLVLAKFVLEHRNIVAAIVLGRHDNLINVPDGKGKDVSGKGPKNLDSKDVALYKEISKVFKETTDQERAPKENSDGSFHAWLYAQRGIPTFATVVWGRPDPSPEPKPDEAEEDDEAEEEADADEGENVEEETPEEKPDKEEPKPSDAEDAAWLTYSDRDRDGSGFVEWKAFDHPTLGAVEIGGFVPGFKMNPPADELDGLAEKQTQFVLELIERRPKLVIQGPDVKMLGPGVYEIRFGIVNEGYLPSATSMASKAKAIPPTVVRISTELDQIIAGERVSRNWQIAGSGGRFTQRWIIRSDDSKQVTIDVVSAQLGDQSISFVPSEVATKEND